MDKREKTNERKEKSHNDQRRYDVDTTIAKPFARPFARLSGRVNLSGKFKGFRNEWIEMNLKSRKIIASPRFRQHDS
jgi:hypothetical protein